MWFPGANTPKNPAFWPQSDQPWVHTTQTNLGVLVLATIAWPESPSKVPAA
jgi:hypothetical protein